MKRLKLWLLRPIKKFIIKTIVEDSKDNGETQELHVYIHEDLPKGFKIAVCK